MSATPIAPSANPVPWMQLILSAAVSLATAFMAMGALNARVHAQERITAPIADGELARLDERTVEIQRDVAWMRDRMEQAR